MNVQEIFLCRSHKCREEFGSLQTLYCENCWKMICSSCVENPDNACCEDPAYYNFEDSKYEEISNRLVFDQCNIHPDYQCVYYCECSAVLCSFCKEHLNDDNLSQHSKHKIILIQDIVNRHKNTLIETRKNILSILEQIDKNKKVLEMAKDRLTQIHQKKVGYIDELKSKIEQIFQQVKEEMTRDVDKESLSDLENLNEVMKQRKQEYDKRKKILEDFQRVFIQQQYYNKIIPFLDSNMVSEEQSAFDNEISRKLEYPMSKYSTVEVETENEGERKARIETILRSIAIEDNK